MSNLDAIRAHQQERAREFEKNLAEQKKAMEDYRNSEQYERDQWEANEDLWEKKAKKEGWHYTRKPFVSALDRQQQADLDKQRKIAELKEKLAQLENQ